MSEKQLRTLFRIAISAFGGFGHELFNTLVALRGLTAGVTKHAGNVESGKYVTDWIAHILLIPDRAESMIRMGMEYRGGPWQAGDPFVTRPEYVLEELQTFYPETSIQVKEGGDRSLDLIYPNVALFTILHELITNAVKASGSSAHVQIAWHMSFDKFICEIDDNGPDLCESLSEIYLDRWGLDIDPWAGLLTVEQTIANTRGSLLFRRSTEFGGTQVKIEFPLVGYWQEDKGTTMEYGVRD